MFFIQWTTAAATAKGSIWRCARCAHCDTDYVYLMEVKIRHEEVELYSRGSDRQRERAVQNAQALLVNQLRRRVDPVPCPSCFRYQPDMCLVLLKQRFEWLYTAGMFLLAGTGMMLMILVPMMVFDPKKYSPGLLAAALVCTGLLLGFGVAALLVKRWLWSNYDPNRRVPEQQRVKEAQDRAMTRVEFERQHPDTKAFEAEV